MYIFKNNMLCLYISNRSRGTLMSYADRLRAAAPIFIYNIKYKNMNI